MAATEQVYVADRAGWRGWLAKHHATSRGVWLIYYKKGSGRPRVSYADAVEEALCFGWIDSTIRSIDDERYCQQFTPRMNTRNWSPLNRRRLRKLIDGGLMTKAGLAKVDPAVLAEPEPAARPRAAAKPVVVPPALRIALKADPAARTFFESLAPSYRRHYAWWIDSAKRDETRNKRLAEAMSLLRAGKRLGIK